MSWTSFVYLLSPQLSGSFLASISMSQAKHSLQLPSFLHCVRTFYRLGKPIKRLVTTPWHRCACGVPPLGVRNTSPTGVRHHLDVLVQGTLINLERVGFPLPTSLLQLLLGDAELNAILHCVNVDNVSIPHEGDRSADLGLRRDVTNAEPVRPVNRRAIPEKGVVGVSLEFANGF